MAAAFLLSCNTGPVGGFELTLNLNDSLQEFEEARIYVDKINLFTREDGTIGYETVPPEADDFTNLLFTLMAGEKGRDPVFNITWIAQAKTVEETAGRNSALFSIKMFPDLPGYQNVAKTAEYIASYNGETCYILMTITNIDTEAKWINGILNGIYIEKIGDRWQRMEIREGRFGANYKMAAGVVS